MKVNITKDKKIQKLLKERTPIVELCGKCKNIEKALIVNEDKELIADVCKIYLYPDKAWIRCDCQKCSLDHLPIVEKCESCIKTKKEERDHINEKGLKTKVKIDICDIHIYPEKQWDEKNCINFRYDPRSKKVNPIKASKRK
jgi:hypothetical protein